MPGAMKKTRSPRECCIDLAAGGRSSFVSSGAQLRVTLAEEGEGHPRQLDPTPSPTSGSTRTTEQARRAGAGGYHQALAYQEGCQEDCQEACQEGLPAA